MDWREQDGVRWLEARLPGARAAFSTRLGGESAGAFESLNLGLFTDDAPDAVLANRDRLGTALGREPENVLFGHQVHGGELLVRDQAPAPNAYTDRASRPPRADGQLTANANLTPLVQVADCLPLALVGAGGVAMLHCGWRGLAAGIVARGASAVDARAAAVGPGIGRCCYEVGDEVLRRFRAARRRDRRWADARPRRGRPSNAREGRRRAGRGGGPVHELRARALLLAPARSRKAPADRRASRGWRTMPEPIHGIEPEIVRRNLERVRERCGPQVEILAATKYVVADEMEALVEAGVTLVGENRLQDLEAKRERYGDAFAWDFIGNLQSRKVKRIVPLVRLIHSVATDSALEQLGRWARAGDGDPRRGQPLRGTGQGRDRARGPRRVHRSLLRSGSPG